ncbi:MAG: hypothetical protein JXB13_12320 [Phycisphaerae bacterium]|nr:hypothetical protein [Phycisphaerae bacterium]
MKKTGTGNRPRLRVIDPTLPKYWLMHVAVDLPRRCGLALPATLTFGPDEVRARLLELVAPDEANPPENVFTPDWWRQVASSRGDRMEFTAQERFRDVTTAVRVTPEDEVVFELSERRKRLAAGIAHAAARIGSALERWKPSSIAFRSALRRHI